MNHISTFKERLGRKLYQIKIKEIVLKHDPPNSRCLTFCCTTIILPTVFLSLSLPSVDSPNELYLHLLIISLVFYCCQNIY